MVQAAGGMVLSLDTLAIVLRVLEEQAGALPPDALGRLKQLQAQVRYRTRKG